MTSKTRRILGAMMIVAGGLLLWLTTETRAGLALLAAAVVLEVAGIALERRRNR